MTVIGPIDHATWYSMRQCNEIIRYLEGKKDPRYDLEIKGEKEIYRHFMDEVVKKAA